MDNQKLSKLKAFLREPRNKVALYISLFWTVLIIAISMARFYPEWFQLLESMHLQTVFFQLHSEQYVTGLKNLENYANNPNLEMVLRIWILTVSTIFGILIGGLVSIYPNYKVVYRSSNLALIVASITALLFLWFIVYVSMKWVPPEHPRFNKSVTYDTFTLYFVSFLQLYMVAVGIVFFRYTLFAFRFMCRKYLRI